MKPILFNTEMVRALLDGRKTVTRRVMKPQPWERPFCDPHEFVPDNFIGGEPTGFVCKKCGLGVCPPHWKYPIGESIFRPYCWPGDILYVRETWGDYSECQPGGAGYYLYRADYPGGAKHYDFDEHKCDLPRWRPSIHMPKEAARLFLRVTDVWVERLHEIGDCTKEGISPGRHATAHMNDYDERCDFAALWDSTVKKADRPLYGWAANPWVWVIELERISKEDAMKGGGEG